MFKFLDISAGAPSKMPPSSTSSISFTPVLHNTFQLACMCTRDRKHGGLGRPALYLDTETFFTPDTFERFYTYFRARWPDLPVKPKIEIRMVNDIFKLGKLFGIDYEIIHEERRVSVVSRFPTKRQKTLKAHGHSQLKTTTKSSDYSLDSEIWKKLGPVF